jgi:putative effector of murein hydrolase LrgA (UPF0299 family)
MPRDYPDHTKLLKRFLLLLGVWAVGSVLVVWLASGAPSWVVGTALTALTLGYVAAVVWSGVSWLRERREVRRRAGQP